LGAVCEAVAGIVLVSYVVRRVSVGEYGVLLLAMSLCGMMYILDIGLSSQLVQAYIAAAKGNRERLSDLLRADAKTISQIG
jgi:hypothetical protein